MSGDENASPGAQGLCLSLTVLTPVSRAATDTVHAAYIYTEQTEGYPMQHTSIKSLK